MLRTSMLGDQQTTETTREVGVGSPCGAELVLRWLHPRAIEATVLGANRITLGRARECDVCLEGREVSRQHAEIISAKGFWLIRDLGSRNGIFVDGERSDVGELKLGRVVRCGEWVAVVDHRPRNTLEENPQVELLLESVLAGPRLRRELAMLQEVAPSNVPILIHGETGTGKDALARLIHDWSGRRGPFCVLDCANLPATLAEATLFGYLRGAFTGAVRDEGGLLLSADGGTLYIDELAELPNELQAKLLRFTETGEVTPVGASKPKRLDVRIVSSVRARREPQETRPVREDLLARLQGATIALPPLRERIADAPDLFKLFLNKATGGKAPAVSAQLVELICLHSWPLNVRELKNTARLLALKFGHERVLGKEHLRQLFEDQDSLVSHSASVSEGFSPSKQSQDDPHREQREVEALREYFGRGDDRVTAAAEALGVGRQRVYTLLERHPELARLRADAAQKPGGSDRVRPG